MKNYGNWGKSTETEGKGTETEEKAYPSYPYVKCLTAADLVRCDIRYV
jgi:hypothetical protein